MHKYILLLLIASLFGTNIQAYEKHTGTIVIDKAHNLYWQDDFSSQKSSEDWDDAVAFCDNLDLAGITHWRLPTFHELFSITDYSRKTPIDPAFTYLNDGSYWTSTPFAANKSRAWTIDFHTGETYYSYKTTNHAVRCVKEISKTTKGQR
ncbi:MAG: hypothetical protein DSZ05_03840 [Sulfurospirillum sp.]|nr:MAG: hypothetical protein DSZ05_03840 [Sulfurospirillum sp.]